MAELVDALDLGAVTSVKVFSVPLLAAVILRQRQVRLFL